MLAEDLLQSIDAVRRRARVLSVAYGVGIVLAGVVGLIVGVIALDYLFNLQALPRVLLMIAAIAGMAYLAWRYVATTAAAPLSRSDVAGRLERAFPQFEDRLRSTVNFVESGRANDGSGYLQQRVIEQATRMAKEVDLGRAIVAKPAVLSLTSAATAFIVIILLASAADRGTLAIITSRLLTPFSALAWPKRVQIDLAAGTPHLVPVGQKIAVSMRLARGDRASMKPILYFRQGDGLNGGVVQQMFMTRADDGSFAASLDARLEPNQATGQITAWMKAGDDRRDIAPITVVPRLAIRTITAEATPPAYAAGRPTISQDLAVAPLVTTEGSAVSITVHFNKPLPTENSPFPDQGGVRVVGEHWPPKPELEILGDDKTAPTINWPLSSPDTAVASFVASKPLRFRLHATDADGFANTALEEYELIVKPDTNLSIQLEKPRQSEERTASAFVPMQAVVEDDCGVDSVRLVVDRLAPSPRHWEFPMVTAGQAAPKIDWQAIESSPERVRFRSTAQWELSTMQLTAGDVIEYALVAQDNFNLGGRRHDPVSTSKLRITIVTPDELAGRVAEELRNVRTQTSVVRINQQRGRQETQQLGDDTKPKPDFDPADTAAATRLAQQQSSTAAATKQLADRVRQSIERLDENRTPPGDLRDVAQDVQQTLDKASEGPMKEASQKLNDTTAPKAAKADRDGDLKSAADAQQDALNQLDRAMAKMETIGSLQATIAEIQQLLAAQQDLRKANEDFSKNHLGQKPQDLAAPDKKKLADIAAKQSELGDRTQQSLDKMAKQATQMQKSDPSASDAMKAASDQGQQSKVPQNQKRASQQTSQNQQANAQSTQQQVELGLQQMLGQLKEAQQRELARLREQMAHIQEQIATLIRRQAGHNLDNLLTQGPAKLKTVNSKVIATLTGQSQRKPDDIKAPEARLLSPAQELTDRNARDLAKSADGSPQLAEVASKLTKAAGKMERAIVSLRDQKIADAYDPSQVDALDALIEAKNQIDDQKKDLDKKNEDQQKDAIRAHYQKIRDAQALVNADTAKVEKSRGADGAVGRAQWPTIRRLPDDQQKLADEIGKMDEDLSSLGSIVYVWANRDVKNSMVGVHDDLAASKTAVATTAEEDRIVEQLDAMIKNLAEKQEEKKFENGGGQKGGSGGGQKKPTMPTEIELKMLKSLQEAVNTSTQKIAAEKTPDVAKLTSLGNRQGEQRNLLGSLLDKASKGQMKIGPEPDNKDQLPEEASASDVDDKELQDSLLGDGKGGAGTQAKVDESFKLVGTRMARSRQRLALSHDPGKVTQDIQDRILKNLDELIDLAHKNSESQPQSASSGGKPGEQQKPGDDTRQAGAQGQNSGSQSQPKPSAGAVNTNTAGAGSKPKDLKDITETAAEWGSVTPRVRQAVIESRGETIVEQYRKIIEDYYGALSAKGSQHDR